MDYRQIIEYLSSELTVKPYQIERSLKNTKRLRNFDVENAEYEIKEFNPNDYLAACAGKIPFKIYNMTLTLGRKRRDTTIYGHKMKINGVEKVSVTTSPEKDDNIIEKRSVWRDLEGRLI